jgi:hypothetical protein
MEDNKTKENERLLEILQDTFLKSRNFYLNFIIHLIGYLQIVNLILGLDIDNSFLQSAQKYVNFTNFIYLNQIFTTTQWQIFYSCYLIYNLSFPLLIILMIKVNLNKKIYGGLIWFITIYKM